MAALTSAIIAIVGLALGWITIEIACKPCLEKGREAIDRSLDPNYDPDETGGTVRVPLNRPLQQQQQQHPILEPRASASDANYSIAKVID
ncbi:hypothetical protein ACLOJK_021824 [Asimina triloba]